jgi:hypothetical protein
MSANLAEALANSGFTHVLTLDENGGDPQTSALNPKHFEDATKPGAGGLRAFARLLGATEREEGASQFEGLTKEASEALAIFEIQGPVGIGGIRNPPLSHERLGLVGSFMATAVQTGSFQRDFGWVPPGGRPFTELETFLFSACRLHGGWTEKKRDLWFDQFPPESAGGSGGTPRPDSIEALIRRSTPKHPHGYQYFWRLNPQLAFRHDAVSPGGTGAPLTPAERGTFYGLAAQALQQAVASGKVDGKPFEPSQEGVSLYWEDFLLIVPTLVRLLGETTTLDKLETLLTQGVPTRPSTTAKPASTFTDADRQNLLAMLARLETLLAPAGQIGQRSVV